ncbi:two-component sensor histidine kinase [Anaerocolumna cellulosilytica]|uniref:histidine kinase n=2 Tax=Anaerocolumna cellulosilytica TaxID=433286 RepID=A0A6S6R5F9_9FIRM|nr:two-component sensor histidine kinase [Anaerocolumna cellulosilytica]
MKHPKVSNKPIKVQVRRTFLKIIAASVLATAITYILTLILLIYHEQNTILPANYYEQQIPAIYKYIEKKGEVLLGSSEKDRLEEIIPIEGMEYQVLNAAGDILYGTYNATVINNSKDIYYKLNKTEGYKGSYIHYIPVLSADDNKTLQGVVLLIYDLKLGYTNNYYRFIYTFAFTTALLPPFIYIILFTLIFSKRFANGINKPLSMLMTAYQKVGEKDLDFEIIYESGDELGQLCNAFNKMKEALKHSLEYQWKLEQERIDTIQNLAHDLKTPISNLMIYAESLLSQDNHSNDKLNRYLQVIHDNAERSVQLVSQMQYTTDLEYDESHLLLAPVNITDFVHAKLAEYELKASRKKIIITFNSSNAYGANFYIDIEKLERILDNVLSNAVSYTPTGGTISVFLKIKNNYIHYTIQDTGIGFQGKVIEKATQRFYRGDNARNSETGHSGLGLYISKQLLEKMNGSLTVGNSETGGARVEIWHKIYHQT